MVRLILITTWDPIGVFGVPATLDDYDNYVLPIIEPLIEGATIDEVEAILYSIHGTKMGFKLNDRVKMRFRAAAESIVGMYENREFFQNLGKVESQAEES